MTFIPQDTIGNILSNLNPTVELPSYGNECKSATALSLTCREMLRAVNDVTEIVLKTISSRHEISQEEIAACWNNLSSRKWLWTNLPTTDLMRDLKRVKAIFALFQDSYNIVRKAGVSNLDLAILSDDPPNFSSGQLKSGFRLLLHSSYPHLLITPFGQFRLLGAGFCDAWAGPPLSEVFLQKVKAAFETIIFREGFSWANEEITMIPAPENPGLIPRAYKSMSPIIVSETFCKDYQGTQQVFFTKKDCGMASYSITHFGKEIADPPSSPSDQEKRSPKLLRVIWKLLQSQDKSTT